MITKAKPIHPVFHKFGCWALNIFLKKRFNKLVVNKTTLKPNHSYLLLCNHFSFLDGPLAYYLCEQAFWPTNNKMRVYIMLQNKQMQKNKWLQYAGCFSIDALNRSVFESFDYAAEKLSTPGNLVLIFPQGGLESIHVDNIRFQDGIKEVVKRVKGDCQILWSSNIIEYFESIKPSIYYNMLDCGTNQDFDFDKLKAEVNAHHKQALERHFRFTTNNS